MYPRWVQQKKLSNAVDIDIGIMEPDFCIAGIFGMCGDTYFTNCVYRSSRFTLSSAPFFFGGRHALNLLSEATDTSFIVCFMLLVVPCLKGE